ncbi:MAG: synthase, partial [Devosia sp.]|nr:synthase [Devosia sp.]
MTDHLRIALAQLNPKVGDLDGNLALARGALAEAVAAHADILLLSELFLTGYIADDLLFKPQFVADAIKAAQDLAADTAGTEVALIIPTIWQAETGFHNALVVAENGKITAIRLKRELPRNDVFYEQRFFTSGPLPQPVSIKGVSIGLPICEDIWHPWVCQHLIQGGAEMLLCPNGSPYWSEKHEVRHRLVKARTNEDDVPLLYLNQIGGQDELVYDGASFGMEPGDKLVFRGESFVADFILSDWERRDDRWSCTKGEIKPHLSAEEAPWRACVLGLRDYVKKNGFKQVVLGLSGGIDSAVVAAMAVDALGPDNVHCIMLPYHYTSEASLTDAKECAELLGVRYDVVAIGGPVDLALKELD